MYGKDVEKTTFSWMWQEHDFFQSGQNVPMNRQSVVESGIDPTGCSNGFFSPFDIFSQCLQVVNNLELGQSPIWRTTISTILNGDLAFGWKWQEHNLAIWSKSVMNFRFSRGVQYIFYVNSRSRENYQNKKNHDTLHGLHVIASVALGFEANPDVPPRFRPCSTR
jgi:hypothetical protein